MIKEKKYYKWVVVALLCGVAFLNYMDRQMLTTMRPAMQVDIEELQSATNFGYLMGIFLWVYGFVSPVAGIAADRFSRKWLIIISLFVWSTVTFAMGYATTFEEVYWLRAFMGISEAVYIPTGLSLIADFHQEKTRSLAIGIHMIGIYLGQASGGFGAVIAEAFSWHGAFHFFGMAGIVYSFVLLLFLKDKRPASPETAIKKAAHEKTPTLKVLALLLTNISFWIILFYFAVPSLPGWAVKNWLPTLFAENLKIPMSEAGPISTFAIAFSSFIGVIIGGILSDKWVQKNLRGRIFTSAIGLGLTIPSLFLIGFGHTLFHVVSAAICFGIGWGMYDANNMPILCQFVPARRRATAYGIMNMTGVFSGAFITGLLGRSSDAGHLGRDLGLLAVIVLVAVVIQLVFLKPTANDFSD
ncbi:MAG TPA: MFS transporter [Agriterribacter sp.]|nr:MFS transporter [Agriterribacter sp.]